MNYRQKLQDPRWQKKRLEVLDAADWKCEICGDKHSQLHVHHVVYSKNTEPWDYAPWVYQVLCDSCHESRHELVDKILDCLALKLKGCQKHKLEKFLENLKNQIWKDVIP